VAKRIYEAGVTDPRTAVSRGWFVEGEGYAAEGGKGEETPLRVGQIRLV